VNVESLPMSAEGYAQRRHELDVLRTDGRRELSEQLLAARRDGDVADNPALQEMLDEQVQLERRIAMLEAWLTVAEVVEPTAEGRAEIGSVVRVRDPRGETFEYELVGPLESDLGRGRVSIAAPVGQALAGQRPGTTVEVAAPRGLLVLEIVSVRPGRANERTAA
jgi:transcription elongation factor GreA